MPIEYSYEEIQRDPAKRAHVMDLIRQHGVHAMAYAALQPGMTYFIEPGIVMVAFMRLPHRHSDEWVLGDPFVDSAGGGTVTRFIAANPRARFVQVTAAHARRLHDEFGFFATPIGLETRLDLSRFTWLGRKRARVRTSIRRAGEHATVRELATPTDQELDAIRGVSTAWLRERKHGAREIIFMDRPLVDLDDPLLRRFGAFDEQGLAGFMICTPVFRSGETTGYLVDITRTLARAPSGTGDLLLHAAVETFRSEKRLFVDLGISPCCRLRDDPLRLHDPLTRGALDLLFRHGNWIFNFRGIARRKKPLGGDEHHVYALHRERFAIPAIWRLLKLCRVV